MKTETVYDKDGNLLGDQFVDLAKLQKYTAMAIMQIVTLDNIARITEQFIKDPAQKKAPINEAFRFDNVRRRAHIV